jgi:DNA-directed RNA polymerase
MELNELQENLENQMATLGYSRYSERKEALEKRGEGSSNKANLKIAQAILPVTIRNLQDWMSDNDYEGRGKRHTALLPLKTISIEKAAAQGLLCAFNMMKMPVKTMLEVLGKSIEAELIYEHLAEFEAVTAHALFKFQKGNGPFRRMKALNRHKSVESWSAAKRTTVAEPIFNAVLKTGLFELIPGNARQEVRYGLTDEGRDLLANLDETFAWAKPMYLPMVTTPKPWTTQTDGGYRTPRGRRYTRLVKTRDPGQRAEIAAAIKGGHMDPFLTGVNSLQETPWQVDTDMLDLVKWVFEEGLGDGMKKFPASSHIPAYQMPDDLDLLDMPRKVYHYNMSRKVREANQAIDCDFAVFRNDIETAEFFSDHTFYLPHNADKRGRVYPIPHFNFQRSDHIKAMFQFAEGKPLGMNGLKWLVIHLANCGDFGKVSKASFDDRMAWVNANITDILNVADDPKATFNWWSKADKPFCFVAACIEYARAVRFSHIPEYVSHLPIALDGSNSGLQHYSMALRAKEEGRMVCLASLDAPEDVYRLVAEASATLVREEAQSSPAVLLEALKVLQPKPEKETPAEYEARMVALAAKTRLAADLWLEYGIDRSVVKRNVMTFCYSSETFGFREQLMEDLMRPLSENVLRGEASHHPLEIDGDGGWFASLYLAKKNWAAVTSLVDRAAGGMKWLKRAAQLLAHEGKPVVWTTPTGLPCRNIYTEEDCVTISLFLFDKNLTLHENAVGKEIDGDLYRTVRAIMSERPGEVIIKSKAASTIAPNVIHSMDASHLLLTANAAVEEGIENFQFIHDSFATHAGDTEKFFWLIRETFVDMYEKLDLFGYLYELVWSDLSPEGAEKLPHPPTSGSLDMDVVRKSLYSFA